MGYSCLVLLCIIFVFDGHTLDSLLRCYSGVDLKNTVKTGEIDKLSLGSKTISTGRLAIPSDVC